MRQSKKARQNAAYISTIVFQKKLLYHALIDGVPLDAVRLPLTDHPLSIIFDRYSRGEYTKEGNRWIFDGPGQRFEMELVDQKTLPKIHLKEFHNQEVAEHYYW